MSPSAPGLAVPLRTTEPAKSATNALAGRADSSGVPRCTIRLSSMTKISSVEHGRLGEVVSDDDRERPSPSQRLGQLPAGVRTGAGVERGEWFVE